MTTKTLKLTQVGNSTGVILPRERREKLRAVHRALSHLRGKQRVCFHLHYIEDWPVKDIADTLELSEGTVKSHLNRARGKIREDQEVLVWRTNP